MPFQFSFCTPEEWKGSIIIPIHKKGDETDCNNYKGISLLPTTFKILSNILLSRLIPHAKEITRDHQCGFRRIRSTIDHIFCIRQMLEKEWEHNEEVHQLFIDFKKAYDSVRREVLYRVQQKNLTVFKPRYFGNRVGWSNGTKVSG